MTIGQLIKELQKHNPAKIVLVSAYEDGYDVLKDVRQIKVRYQPTDKYWKGLYNDYPVDECTIDAILLPR